MKALIFVVQDNILARKTIRRLLDKSGISCIFASSLRDAIVLFKQNEKLISHITLDYTLTDSNGKSENTMALAEVIDASKAFKGEIFVTSEDYENNCSLIYILGRRCQNIVDTGLSIKLDSVDEIIRRIEEKRKKDNKK